MLNVVYFYFFLFLMFIIFYLKKLIVWLSMYQSKNVKFSVYCR